MCTEYAWTQYRYGKGSWSITEVIERNGKIEYYDWGIYKRSMETRIEAVAEILDKYPNAKFDPRLDRWYLADQYDYRHYFEIWNSLVYAGPWDPSWDELEDEDDYDFD